MVFLLVGLREALIGFKRVQGFEGWARVGSGIWSLDRGGRKATKYGATFCEHSPKDPCAQMVYTSAHKYLYRY